MAQAFANFGSTVYLTNRSKRILIREEEEGAKIIHKALEEDGVNIFLNVKFLRFEQLENKKIFAVMEINEEKRTVIVDHVLVSVGKKPNVEVSFFF